MIKHYIYSGICNKSGSEDEQKYKIEEKHLSHEFRLKNLDETRNYFLEE